MLERKNIVGETNEISFKEIYEKLKYNLLKDGNKQLPVKEIERLVSEIIGKSEDETLQAVVVKRDENLFQNKEDDYSNIIFSSDKEHFYSAQQLCRMMYAYYANHVNDYVHNDEKPVECINKFFSSISIDGKEIKRFSAISIERKEINFSPKDSDEQSFQVQLEQKQSPMSEENPSKAYKKKARVEIGDYLILFDIKQALIFAIIVCATKELDGDHFDDYKFKYQKSKKENNSQNEKQVIPKVALDDDEKNMLERSQNIILYGPPGTGKTKRAEEYASYLLGHDKKDYDKRRKLVQFHPGYSYNDFIENMNLEKWNDPGAEIYVPSIFKRFAKEAANEMQENPDDPKKYVLIIDEINRANASVVLGELLYGLEYREKRFTTSLSGEEFSVPKNLYIIGTMNTADRSLESLDYALRRRFTFKKVLSQYPASKSRLGKNLPDHYLVESKDGNILCFMKKLFDTVRSHVEVSVARGVKAEDIMPGVSYFLVNPCQDENKSEPDLKHLQYKLKYELIPLLLEYSKNGMFAKCSKLPDGNVLTDLLKGKATGNDQALDYYQYLKNLNAFGEIKIE